MSLADLATYDKKRGTRLVDAVNKLSGDWTAPEGERRLMFVAEHFSKLSLEQARRLLEPEAYRREVEDTHALKKRAKFFQFGRIGWLWLHSLSHGHHSLGQYCNMVTT